MHWRWNSCLQLVNYKTKNRIHFQERHSFTTKTHKNKTHSLQEQSIWASQQISNQMCYRRRITVTECFKAYAASIITSFLHSSFNKSCSWCHMILRIFYLFHPLNLQKTKPHSSKSKSENNNLIVHFSHQIQHIQITFSKI